MVDEVDEIPGVFWLQNFEKRVSQLVFMQFKAKKRNTQFYLLLNLEWNIPC